MPRYGIHVVKRGYVEIEARELDAATMKAAGLKDEAFAWENREFDGCEEITPNPRNAKGGEGHGR